MAIASINPANGEMLREFAALTQEEVENKLAAAESAFRLYRTSSVGARGAILVAAADLLQQEADALAGNITLEMGKPIGAARDEVRKCASACRYYAENGARFIEEEMIQTAAACSSVRWQPLGAVLAIMPWNFPFWQVFRFAAPALMAGNVGLLKHAANVPQCALAIEDIWRRAGAPPGTFQTLLIEAEAGRSDHRGSPGTGGDADRERPGRKRSGGDRGARAEEMRAGTGWERSLHRDAERRSGGCPNDSGESADPEQRSILHCG